MDRVLGSYTKLELKGTPGAVKSNTLLLQRGKLRPREMASLIQSHTVMSGRGDRKLRRPMPLRH